jgi:hypothetical protein
MDGSKMTKRMLYGGIVTLTLILSPNLAQAVPTKTIGGSSQVRLVQVPEALDRQSYANERYAQNSDFSTNLPLMQVIPQRDGSFLLEPLCPPKPGGHNGRDRIMNK